MLGSDKICAVVAASDADHMSKQLVEALRGARTIELRLDWLADDRQISKFLAALRGVGTPGVTLIATCRRRQAGGRFKGTVAKQLFHLAEAARAGCSWYDLEVETVRQCPTELIDALLGDGRQLRSAHFFDRMPNNLHKIAEDLRDGGPDAIKIAAQCDSLSEALKLERFAAGQKNLVAIPMGEAALPARILALREKQGFAYAPVEQATAPGQVSLNELKNLYRADRIDERTQVYGVVGDPIAHSLSPVMQNAAFAKRGMNALYLPFRVHRLEDFLRSIKPLGIRGFSVTLPHKERIMEHLDGCDQLARQIGAVNTVVVRNGGRLYGYNTDYVGVLRALQKRMALRGTRVLILGAGGASRAVALALEQAGSSVCVYARRLEKAKALAKVVKGEAITRPTLRGEFFDAIVNATPVGMHPAVGQSPLGARELNCRLVFDTIYRPRSTRLLQMAAKRGIETVSGVEMFVAQGAAQWEIWTGERAPEGVMRRAVIQALEQEEKKKTQLNRRGVKRDDST